MLDKNNKIKITVVKKSPEGRGYLIPSISIEGQNFLSRPKAGLCPVRNSHVFVSEDYLNGLKFAEDLSPHNYSEEITIDELIVKYFYCGLPKNSLEIDLIYENINNR